MKLTNIITLGVLGYSTDDVKSIQAAGVAEDDIIALAKAGKSAADINEYIKLAAEEPKPEPEPEPEPKPEPEELKKHEEELKKLKDENDKLTQTLKEAQKSNIQKDISGAATDAEKSLNELFASFM